jgi:uncharacterized protein (TIGR02171 family)
MKKRLAHAAALLSLTVMFFCSPHSTSSRNQPEYPHSGMAKIASSGVSFQQGLNDTFASVDERPGMKSSFLYDYFIDVTEITQKQYFDMTGKRPVPDTSRYGYGDNYPVYYVSWFDAALYCNARSRAENLDTVYVYSGALFSKGSAYELTGLWCNMAGDGYRLPTEAEWEFAARGASSDLRFTTRNDSNYALDVAWYSANSAGATHPVAGKTPNAFGLYDVSGNVFEWTNDWKCFYNGKDIANSLGGIEPDKENEKVIKGGSFNYDLFFLRPSHRSASYATSLSSTCEYVGFRCARGAIVNGNYIGTGPSAAPNPVTCVADAGIAQRIYGTSRAEIVFVNITGASRTLCFVDFSRSFPYVRQFMDDENVYMPAISPDGRYVAYCSNDVGMSGSSVITVRSLDSLNSPRVTLTADSAFAPHWTVDPAAGDTSIVYTNSGIVNNSAQWKSTKTFTQTMRSGRQSGLRRELISDGSYHDGISADGRYAVTSYTRLMARDLSTGEEKQLFLPPHNGKDANGSTQVCNASMSPDTGADPHCMFLDFGSPTPSTVTGGRYGVHQYLFIASFTDSITWCMRCPPSENEWDYPKWSNVNRFAASCVRNTAGNAHAVHSIDLWQGTSREILSGVELAHPYLWINGQPGLTPDETDSLGAYNDPPVYVTQTRFAGRMHFFWQWCDSMQFVFAGSSHAALSIDPHAFKNHKVYNLAFEQGDIPATRTIIKNYVLNHCTKVKFIGIDFITGFLIHANGMDISFARSTGQSKGYAYDSLHSFWKNSLTDHLRSALINKPYDVLPEQDSCNNISRFCGGWGGDNPSMYGTGGWDTTNATYQENVAGLESLISELNQRKIHLLFIITPENPAYAKLGFAGRYGPSLDVGRQIVARFKLFESQYPYFHLYDANQFGNHDYTDAEAWDPDHLCSVGAPKMSARIDSVMDSILAVVH